MALSPLTSWPSGRLAFSDGRPAHGAQAIVSRSGSRTTVYQDALGRRVMPQPIRVQPGGFVPGFVSAPCTIAATWRKQGRSIIQAPMRAAMLDKRTLELTHLDPPPMPVEEMMATIFQASVTVNQVVIPLDEIDLTDLGVDVKIRVPVGTIDTHLTDKRRIVGPDLFDYGLRADGTAYYDSAGVVASERACLTYNPGTGELGLLKGE